MQQSPLQMLFGRLFDNTRKPTNDLEQKVLGNQSPLHNNRTFFSPMEDHALNFDNYLKSLRRPPAKPVE